ELLLMIKAVKNGLPIIIEGPVGTGKTEMAKALSLSLEQQFVRVDGDDSLTSIKLKGWYDPPLVIEKGFSRETFIPGPLTQAMEEGGIFFYNEVNRAPSETINAVLTALDERLITIPQLGEIKASDDFVTIFTYNPLDTVATNPLPKAFYDRCIWIYVNHQSLEEMMQIVELRTGIRDKLLTQISCEIVQTSLNHPELESGTTVRGAIQLVQLYTQNEEINESTLIDRAIAVHSRKIRCKTSSKKDEIEIIEEIVSKILSRYEDERIIRKKEN
ncbi:MAG: MoxR family ATPase, partial [Candidatus Heimdallarchaeota archaeon]|nr:MoxR family ATPase [Candidatus Heimdallarchaeota archaeon]MCK4955778.1 MoxR family ATPase [Candidatus Heimdallarchaeota archaeon]